MKTGKRPIIYGDGTQSRDFTFIDNTVEANIIACFKENVSGETFNIACGERYTLVELVNYINEHIETPIEPIFEKERIGDVKHSLSDIDKAKSKLGYRVLIDFKTGLNKLIELL